MPIEPNEPPQIHIDRDDLSAKFWLDPVQLAANFGFRAHELREMQSSVADSRTRFLEAWNEFFASSADERVLDVEFTDDTISVNLRETAS